MNGKDVQSPPRKKYERPELTRHSPLREVTIAHKCACTTPVVGPSGAVGCT